MADLFGGGPVLSNDPAQIGVVPGGNLPLAAPSTGINWDNVGKALELFGQGLGAGQQQQQGQQAPPPTGDAPQARLGTPINRQSLDTLVQLLNKRREQYFQQAMSGRAQPVSQGAPTGLLGF